MFGHYQPTHREPKQLRSTQSYVYYTDDKKGEGATGSVFGGREKKSGEKVAVKVFNHVSYRRPGSVQEREFDVLLKLKHPNIVKLLAIEDDQLSKDRVIVMELCNGGSLFNVLDRPENSFGMAEAEFLILLRDVSSGMKHLQDKGMVHRDLKPGNIMCCIGPDGCSVYKLADFGAARELAEGENFVSLYGTEEYLHPDVYERAVLRKPLVRPFTASVDLWSIGVTLFHAAAGVLPFRPYGGRRNRTTMHNMTTLKASGIISGVQKGSEDGEIEWSREMPKTTQLSKGLRCHVEGMFAGLLESDLNKMWSFQTFYETAQSIVRKTVLDVFDVATSQLLKVYINPTYSFAEFQEHIAMQTSLQSAQQLLIFDDVIFYPDSSIHCQSFRETSPANPIFLFRRTFDGAVSPVTPITPTVPPAPSRYSLESDAPKTKISIAAVYCLKRKQERIFLMQQLLNKAVKSLTHVIKDEEKLLRYHVARLESPNRLLPSKLDDMRRRINLVLVVTQGVLSRSNGRRGDLDRVCDFLEIFDDELALKIEDVQKFSSRYREVSSQLQEIHDVVVKRNALEKSWIIESQCRSKDKCIERFNVSFQSLGEIFLNFRRDSKMKSLPYNEEQIHKMEKIKFNDTLPLIVSLVQDHCETNWRNKHGELMEWCSLAFSLREQISEVDKDLSPLVSEASAEEIFVSKLGERCREKTDEALKEVLLILKGPHSSINYIDNSYQQRIPYIADSTSVSLQLWDTRQFRQMSDTETQTETINTNSTLDTPNANERSDNHHTENTTKDIRCTNHAEYCNDSRPVPVPRDLKQGFLEWKSEISKTREDVQKSQELLEKMQNVSLGPNSSLEDMYGC